MQLSRCVSYQLSAISQSASLPSRSSCGHVAGNSVVWGEFFEGRHVSEATGFLGARFPRAQHRTAGVEAAHLDLPPKLPQLFTLEPRRIEAGDGDRSRTN